LIGAEQARREGLYSQLKTVLYQRRRHLGEDALGGVMKRSVLARMAAVAVVGSSAIGMAQSPPSPPPANVVPLPAPSSRPGWVRIPAGFPIDIEVVDPLSSKTSVHGDHFAIKLGNPIIIDGHAVVPAGTAGVGEVIDGAKARAMGKAGELIIAARTLDDNGITIPLGHFHFAEAGQDRSGTAAVVAIAVAPVVSLFIVGGEVMVPSGTHATAKVAQDIDVPIPGAPAPAPATTTTAAPTAAL
jgi:hypothetical protein